MFELAVISRLKNASLFPLQAQPVDLSWLPLMGEIALGIVGVIAIAVIFIKRGLPKCLEYKKEVEMAKIGIKKEVNFCGDLQVKHENQLRSIEKILVEDIEKQNKWQNFINERINKIDSKIEDLSSKLEDLFSIVSCNENSLHDTSDATFENQLFNEKLWPFKRLQAFRILLARKRNGRIWEKGFYLVLENKEVWLDLLDTELGVKIVDIDYYNMRMEDIRTRIFEDFTKRNK